MSFKIPYRFFSVLYLSLTSSLSIASTTPDLSQYHDESLYSDEGLLFNEDLLKEAKNLVDKRKYEEAAFLYKELLAQDPDNIDYLIELGLINVSLGHRKEAIELYERALRIDPDNQKVEVDLAFAYLFENNLQKSEEIFEKVIEKSPDNPDALAGIGYIAMLKGEESEAEQIFEKAIKNNPKNMTVTARIYLGNLRLRQHRISEAKEIFEMLNGEDPNNQDVQQGLLEVNQAEKQVLEDNSKEKIQAIPQPVISATASENEERLVKEAEELRQQKKYKEAAELYEDLVTAHPENVDYLLALGRLYVSINRKTEAIDLYKRALSLQPKRQDVRASLAFTYLFTNELEKSRELFQVVLEQDPNDAEVLAGLGNIATKNGNVKEAEEYLEKAVQIDPQNITALIYFADLKMRQKHYPEAYEIYKKISQIDLNDPDAAQGISDVQEKMLNEKTKQLVKEKRYKEAEDAYQSLIESYPKNVDYLLGIARIYQLQENKSERIQALNRALELEPNRQDIRVLLAFAYLFDDKWDLSKKNFQQVLEKEPNNSEALAGLGRLAAIQKHPEEAEEYYQKALEINPDNATALEFQALLKLQQKKYKEALTIYSKLLSMDPRNVDYNEGFHNSQDIPLVDRAKVLREHKNSAGAAALYEQLVSVSPENIEYLLMLGHIYVDLNRKDDAIELYNQGLAVKPDDKDLLRALGFIYLNKALNDVAEGTFRWDTCFPFVFLREKTNLFTSKELFESVLEQEPRDADALAAMGRIELIEGFVEDSEDLYFDSLDIDPKNTTALSYLAALQTLQKKYYSANNTYRYLIQIDPNDEDAKKNYKEFLDIKRPYVDVSSYYEEENEKDLITQEWAARLKNYGGGLTYVSPIKDKLKLVANMACDYIVLKNLINGTTIYSLDIQRPKLGIIWNSTSNLSVSGGLGLALFTKYHEATFSTKWGCYYQPYLNISYSKNFHTCSLETLGDTPIVARDFVTNKATLIARQFLNGFYEYDFTKRRTVGALASYGWYYNRIKDNQYQFGSAWIQVTPPCYWENISLRYQFNYGRFNDLTIDYYTFRPQLSHWLKLDLTKKWCDDKVIGEAGYSHCWQRSFEQGQIITITPVPVFHWVNRRINAAYARVKIVFADCLNASVTGTYSHDNFYYTTASISANIHMRF